MRKFFVTCLTALTLLTGYSCSGGGSSAADAKLERLQQACRNGNVDEYISMLEDLDILYSRGEMSEKQRDRLHRIQNDCDDRMSTLLAKEMLDW